MKNDSLQALHRKGVFFGGVFLWGEGRVAFSNAKVFIVNYFNKIELRLTATVKDAWYLTRSGFAFNTRRRRQLLCVASSPSSFLAAHYELRIILALPQKNLMHILLQKHAKTPYIQSLVRTKMSGTRGERDKKTRRRL